MSGPRIYFAGVNTQHLCSAFAGHHVLESYADGGGRKLLERYRPTFASVALDCGAYSEMTTGKPIDLAAYIDFCLEHAAGYSWVASLDVIGGGPEENVKNWQSMLAAGVEAIPTFHQGEPFSLLSDYCAAAKRIGLGFKRPIQNARPWLSECFARIPAGFPVHGWAMTAYTDFPFDSVDSRTWFFEMRALMSVEGQGADALRCLTPGELLEIVIKKYERLPLRERWEGKAAQLPLLEAV